MNRFVPLIVRQPLPAQAPQSAALTASAAMAEEAVDPLADLKLFATGWLGGLVFFGTLLA